MKKTLAHFAVILLIVLGLQEKPAIAQTYCNPINLSRQFSSDYSLREGINDPTIVLFRDKYYLFASNAGCYWYSTDLLSWKFVSDTNLPLDGKEPTATVIGDWLYFFTAFNGTIYRTKEPEKGKWEEYAHSPLLALVGDYAIFTDTDGRVYSYYGCTNNTGVMSRELDPKDRLNPIGAPIICQLKKPLQKTLKKTKISPEKEIPGVSGSWMTKYNGKYYYQCTELSKGFNKYSDVVYVSDSPTGPFTYAANNPVSLLPEGFVSGASKGSTFEDKYGNWWHIAAVMVSSSRNSQPALALFPAGFDKEGNFFVKADFGDLPIVMPKQKNENISRLDPEWTLIAEKVTAEASSSSPSSSAMSAIDADINTYWSARSGKKGEWISLDLGSECTINALQVNFAKNRITNNRSDSVKAYQYLVEHSLDGKNWKKLLDKTTNLEYQLNDYNEFKTAVRAKYLKITNYNVPEGVFAISELRVFGQGTHRKPKKINELKVVRDYRDPQAVKLFWKKQPRTTGYNIRYGIDKEKLYHSFRVLKSTRITIHCPDKIKAYWFQVDAYNENGVSPGKPVLCH